MGRYITQDPIGLSGGLNNAIYPTNPIQKVDPLGLSPGDCYRTINAAGTAAISDINYKSIQDHVEYGGRIYRNPNGSYSYTAPIMGNIDSVSHGPNIPNRAGLYHTHGAFDPGYDNENFSPDDERIATNANEPSYLGTPSGVIKKFNPATNKTINMQYPNNNNLDTCSCR
jgi:uncharacterized protein RhaS with RHS repeats